VNAADEPVPEKTAILVWDLPTRILHWALAGTSGGALAIGLTVEKEHPLFRWHVILGVMAGFFVVLRLIWGVIGTKYARFTHFPLRPTMLGRYCRHLFRRDWRDFPGLNPAAAWVSTGVLVAVGLLVLTGPGFGGKRPGEAHKLPAYALLGLIALHAVELTCCSIDDHRAKAREAGRCHRLGDAAPGDRARGGQFVVDRRALGRLRRQSRHAANSADRNFTSPGSGGKRARFFRPPSPPTRLA